MARSPANILDDGAELQPAMRLVNAREQHVDDCLIAARNAEVTISFDSLRSLRIGRQRCNADLLFTRSVEPLHVRGGKLLGFGREVRGFYEA